MCNQLADQDSNERKPPTNIVLIYFIPSLTAVLQHLFRQRLIYNMSFRSAWRHAAKTSPSSSPHIAPHGSGTTTTTTTSVNGRQSEPTLVVTNSRPSSTHDLRMDQPAKPLIQENTKLPNETGRQPSLRNLAMTPRPIVKSRNMRPKVRSLRMGVGLPGGVLLKPSQQQLQNRRNVNSQLNNNDPAARLSL